MLENGEYIKNLTSDNYSSYGFSLDTILQYTYKLKYSDDVLEIDDVKIEVKTLNDYLNK